MKIGIISINMYSKGLNFACPLHNYAFQQFLKKNGIDSTVISYKPIYFNNFDLRHPYDYYAQMCERFEAAGRDKTEVAEWERITSLRDAWKELYAERERRYDKFQHFIDTNYVKTEECYDSDLLEVEDPGFDCYICCTDVIWKKEPNVGFDRGFFLASKAMENKWKISYAASRGVHFSETKEDEELFFHYINDIDAVSVREESLKNYLESHTDKKITQVIDPVLLHEKEFYDAILQKPEEEHYIFLYYVMERAEDTIDQAIEYAKANHLKIVEITERPLKNGRLSECEDVEVIYNYDMGIEEWLGYIKYADCVFTNSFHCCCFSILFEKQLYVGSRNGDKVANVLNMFGLSERRINKDSDIVSNPRPDIDYEAVRPILEEKRKDSKEFILSAIHDIQGKKRPVHDYEAWKRELKYPVFYNSGMSLNSVEGAYTDCQGKVKQLASGSGEFYPEELSVNNGKSKFIKNGFFKAGYTPNGWRIRIRIDKSWFWYLEDGTFMLKEQYNRELHGPIKKFSECDTLPYFPFNNISLVVAEALWKEATIFYNSGTKSEKLEWRYHESSGTVKRLKSGSAEYRADQPVLNNGKYIVLENQFINPGHKFIGWRMRVKEDDSWYWYLEDGSLKLKEKYDESNDRKRYLLKEGEKIPHIPAEHISSIALEAVWKVNLKSEFMQRVKKLRGRK